MCLLLRKRILNRRAEVKSFLASSLRVDRSFINLQRAPRFTDWMNSILDCHSIPPKSKLKAQQNLHSPLSTGQSLLLLYLHSFSISSLVCKEHILGERKNRFSLLPNFLFPFCKTSLVLERDCKSSLISNNSACILKWKQSTELKSSQNWNFVWNIEAGLSFWTVKNVRSSNLKRIRSVEGKVYWQKILIRLVYTSLFNSEFSILTK